MRHLTRPRLWGVGALLTVAVVTAPVAAQADPRDGTPASDDSRATSATEHDSLEGALAELGATRGDFREQSALAERLSAASDDYTVRFPTAFAGVRIVGATGQVAVVHGADGVDLLTQDARARGFTVRSAPAPARELDETADRVQAWADSLPPGQRDAVTTIDVDPSTGDVTVVVEDSAAVPRPPADLGAGVRSAGFRPAQGSVGSSTATLPDAPPTTQPPATLLPDSLVGGTRVLVSSPSGPYANWCSLGFNGIRDGRVVNITAAHCSSFTDPATSRPAFLPGTISEGSSPPRLGAFTAAEADEALDAALITVDPEDQPRFRNSHVLGAGALPLALSGTQSPVVGQVLCKYGQRTGYTCGKVSGVDSAFPGGTTNVEIDLCAISGDSGGVVFSETRAVAVTSLSNAFDSRGQPYPSCQDARTDLARIGAVPMMVGVTVGSIAARFPGLQVGAS
ncbi:S1 family peptidase [Dietzia sp. PP-33]|jgi:streptogrisin C|uniref:S1 family peptidase n=1 Tax=Dietzia sp. PP-33 TaxID=2957500 RepID=UPI0029A7F9C5|nr:S1 family peptidase [Dietzia sp. PP-33]MDX2356246.1 S1 family peptidase [Dietzia sp. PP-33]